MWLFDTVALSELFKERTNAGFQAWLATTRVRDFHTSVLCLGEVRRGVVMLAAGAKRDAIAHWLHTTLIEQLGPRILPVSAEVAQRWGRLGQRGASASIDALIGSTAGVHGLAVVTRNSRDFEGLGVPVLNPWT